VATLEIHGPTSGAFRVLHGVAVNQAIEIAEFAEDIRALNPKWVLLSE
jgi:hypothetical protein